MKAVPWWFQTLAHMLAVLFAAWVGLHYKAPVEWMVIYGLAAVASAALPAHRLAGYFGLVVGIAIGGWGAYLLRDVWNHVSLDALVSFKDGPLGGGRDAVMLAVAALWLIAASAFRTQRA